MKPLPILLMAFFCLMFGWYYQGNQDKWRNPKNLPIDSIPVLNYHMRTDTIPYQIKPSIPGEIEEFYDYMFAGKDIESVGVTCMWEDSTVRFVYKHKGHPADTIYYTKNPSYDYKKLKWYKNWAANNYNKKYHIPLNQFQRQSGLASQPTGGYILALGMRAASANVFERNIIVIGDFKNDRAWMSGTVHYEREFWYFQTPKGKRLLAYLDEQSQMGNDTDRIQKMQSFIKQYYVPDYALEIEKRALLPCVDTVFYWNQGRFGGAVYNRCRRNHIHYINAPSIHINSEE